MLEYLLPYILAIMGVLFSIIGFFGVRTLNQIDTNQKKMFENLDTQTNCLTALSKDFYHLKGEHDAIMRKCQGVHEE